MSYEDRLRRLALHDPAGEANPGWSPGAERCDPKCLALARIAALVAVDGPVSAYSELVDLAVGAGASPDETVDMLENLAEIVGWPLVVKAAPRLAIALGYDIEKAIEQPG